jgi:hypothetical protein
VALDVDALEARELPVQVELDLPQRLLTFNL